MTAGRQRRLDRVREAMGSQGVDALLLSLGADLPWLTGYEAMPLERLTMLVLPVDADASLVIPALEAPRCEVDADAFSLRPWSESEDPVEIVAGLVGGPNPVGHLRPGLGHLPDPAGAPPPRRPAGRRPRRSPRRCGR